MRKLTGHAWTEAEKRTIARTSLQLMSQNQAMPQVEAVRAAVEKLPTNRRHDVRDMHAVRWIKPLWADIADELDAEHDAQQAHDDAALKVSAPAPTVEPEAVPPSEETPPLELEPTDGVNIDAPKRGRGRPKSAATSEPAPEVVEPVDKAPKKRGGTKGMTMVRWKDAERRTLAKAFIKMQSDFPDLKETEAFRKAMQYSLPDDRQRNVVGIFAERDWLYPLVEEVRAEVEQEAKEIEARKAAEYQAEQERIDAERAEREAQAEAERQAAAAAEQATIAAEMEKLRLIDRVERETIAGLTVQELQAMLYDRQADIIAQKVMDRLMGPLEQLIKRSNEMAVANAHPFGNFGNRPSEPIPEGERAAPAPRDRKPRVLICGVFNEWIQDIKREFDATLQLDFFKGSQDGGPQLEGMLKGKPHDLVVHMTDFSRHDREQAYRKAGIKPLRVTGSVSALKRELRKWLLGDLVRVSAF
jgi:hypothetical protein